MTSLVQSNWLVKKSLDDNPARLHIQAGVLIVTALLEAFPCVQEGKVVKE
jgi:hypothetical protein